MTKTPPDTEAVIRISYQSSLGDNRGGVFETYMPLSSSVAQLNAVMDKLRSVCDIQNARTSVKELARQLQSDEAALSALVADKERIAGEQIDEWDRSGRKGPFKLNPSQLQHKQNIDGSIINRQKSIEMVKARIAEFESIIKEAD